MVYRRFAALAGLIDPSVYSSSNLKRRSELTEDEWAEYVRGQESAMHYVQEALLKASIPSKYSHGGSYAIDASNLPSWARQNKKWPDPQYSSDPDASWMTTANRSVAHARHKGKGKGGPKWSGKSWYGYQLNALVRVDEMDVRKNGEISTVKTSPNFIEAISVHTAKSDTVVDGLRLLSLMRHGQLRDDPDAPASDLLMDRAYSQQFSKFLEPATALGYTCHFDLRAEQRGVGGQVEGMIIIDGQPYSPSIPERLRTGEPPKFGTPNQEKDWQYWWDVVEQRAKYAIRLRSNKVGIHAPMEFSCPAARDFSAAKCTNKPESVTLGASIPVLVPSPALQGLSEPPKICRQQRVSAMREDLPLWQPYQYGSKAWAASYARRSRVEGLFGNLKNEATEGLRRGNIRVMGRAKTFLMTVFLCAAVNRRLARLDDERSKAQTKPSGPRRGGKAKRVSRIVAVAQNIVREASELYDLAAP